METRSPDERSFPRRAPWLSGALIANVLMAVLYLGLELLIHELPTLNDGAMIVPSLLIIPAFGGLVAMWYWRGLNLRIGQTCLYTLFLTVLGIGGAAIFLREGTICLLIVSPLLYCLILAGALLGRVWFRRDPTKLQVSIIPLLAVLAVGEMGVRRDHSAIVTDEILIHAPPEKVWPHVLAFPEIPDAPTYWLFRLGLPYPTRTTNGGNFVGADRQCIFSDNIVIGERVAELVPNERLTFDIVKQPDHPEAYGHITLERGQFVLRDNHDGTTTLIGSSWYTLHVRPLFYFNAWTADITRTVHLRVMHHIQRLAEG